MLHFYLSILSNKDMSNVNEISSENPPNEMKIPQHVCQYSKLNEIHGQQGHICLYSFYLKFSIVLIVKNLV